MANHKPLFSERELSSVCNVRAPYSYQAIEIFGNVSTPFGTPSVAFP